MSGVQPKEQSNGNKPFHDPVVDSAKRLRKARGALQQGKKSEFARLSNKLREQRQQQNQQQSKRKKAAGAVVAVDDGVKDHDDEDDEDDEEGGERQAEDMSEGK